MRNTNIAIGIRNSGVGNLFISNICFQKWFWTFRAEHADGAKPTPTPEAPDATLGAFAVLSRDEHSVNVTQAAQSPRTCPSRKHGPWALIVTGDRRRGRSFRCLLYSVCFNLFLVLQNIASFLAEKQTLRIDIIRTERETSSRSQRWWVVRRSLTPLPQMTEQ